MAAFKHTAVPMEAPLGDDLGGDLGDDLGEYLQGIEIPASHAVAVETHVRLSRSATRAGGGSGGSRAAAARTPSSYEKGSLTSQHESSSKGMRRGGAGRVAVVPSAGAGELD